MYRGKETHSTHAWMVAKLVVKFQLLQEYVVAACFKKMLGRMEHKLSLPYIEAIASFSDFQFKETHYKPEMKERKMEWTFGNALVSLNKAGRIDTTITKLLSIIPPPESDNYSELVELYTKDTCQEYHMLLGELLRKFKRNLGELAKMKLKKTGPTQSEFEIALRNVVYYGDALQMLAGGVAIQRHLQVIEDELIDFHHKRARDVANQAATPMLPDVEELIEANPENGDDEELQSVQPFANRALPMWKSAKDWLKLMVVHFDATKIISGYYREAKLNTLTIKILLGPKFDTTMLTWKGLLQDEKYIKPIIGFNPYHIPTSEEIIQFIEDQLGNLDLEKGTCTIIELQKKVDGLIQSSGSKAVSPVDLETLETSLSGLRVGISPDQDELTKCIRSKIEELRGIDDESPKSPESRRDYLYSIAEMLESLRKSSLFFKKLRSGSALSEGNKFTDPPHCEILLASLIVMAKSSPSLLPPDILQELSVSHIIQVVISI
jgi:hypothetical protein